jgi:hypothetical protein
MQTLPARIDLIKMLPPGSVVAEIGCWRAYFAVEILNSCPNVHRLFCVDAWKKQTGYVDPLSDDDHEENLRQAKHHLRGHLPSGRVRLVRGESAHVAVNDRTIPPLDGVFIDADHGYEACLTDLRLWSKRLKKSGVIMGHDYTNNEQAKKWNFGVIEAVAKFCEEEGWRLTHLTAEDFASYRLEPLCWSGAEL